MVQCAIAFQLILKNLAGCELGRHFERSFKKLSSKPHFWMVPLSLLGALVLSVRGTSHGSSVNDLPFGHSIQKPELSCGQVLKLADWGQKKFGGIGTKDVFSPERAPVVAQVFLEKLDPSRMFFVAEDVNSLKKLAQSHWTELVKESSCEFWQQWLESQYPKAQQRVARFVKKFKAPKNLVSSSGQEAKEVSYSQFAVSIKDLEVRWQKELTQILNESSPSLLKAYNQNVTQLLWDRVEQRYFDVSPETRGLLAKALLGGLDSYSTYFSTGEFEEFYEELKGSAAGLGLRLQKVPQGFLVEKVIESSAAEKSKELHEGDIIAKVDEVDLASLPFEEAKRILKGPENTKVKLGIECSHKIETGKNKYSEVTLERSQFELEETKINFSWKKVKQSNSNVQKVGVISVPTFYGRGGMGEGGEEKSVSEDFKQRITEELLKDTSHVGLVLDLRGNPGGYLEEAVGMGSMFVGGKPIVGVLEDGKTRVLKEETGTRPIYQKPLVVLVDPGSASAAEVLSGALKDYQRAIIVGSSRTYGKGTVQKLFHLEDPLLFSSDLGPLGTGVVKLTTSVFYSPLGHTPANGGVTADIVLNDKNSSLNPVNKIEDILPIVDNDLRLELEKASVSHQNSIQLLTEKSLQRVSGAEIKSAESELDEAVAIVSDLADLKTF
jgi:carboxyl-terminal processing protease